MAAPITNGPFVPPPNPPPKRQQLDSLPALALTQDIAAAKFPELASENPPPNDLATRVSPPLSAKAKQTLNKALSNTEYWKSLNKESQTELYHQVEFLWKPIANKCPQCIFVNWLSSNIFPELSKSPPITNLQQFAYHPFLELIKQLNPNSPHNFFIINKISQHKIIEEKDRDLLLKALEHFTPDMSDFEQALVIDTIFQPPAEAIDTAARREQHQTNQLFTYTFNQFFGEKIRNGLDQGEILLHAYVLPDGIGDLIHLNECKKRTDPFFKGAVNYAAFIETEEEERIPQIAGTVDTNQILLEEGNDFNKDSSDEMIGLFEQASVIFGVSQSHPEISENFADERPFEILHEISNPTDPTEPLMTMGLKSGNAGIWFSEFPKDPQETLTTLSDSLKSTLGCSEPQGSLTEWYSGSLVNASMVYEPSEDDRAIFTTLAICQKTKPNIKRIIFKTKQPPNFTEEITPEIVQRLQQLNVGNLIMDNEAIFTGSRSGIELRIITKKLNEVDWVSYKALVNGINGVGGDNTLSEALSNPTTLPPLMFSQHPHKQDAYYGVIDLAQELDDSLPGKAGLIEYLQMAKQLAYWAPAFEYGMELAEIAEKTGEEPLRAAWKALAEHASQVANLNDFIVPLITEQIFLEKNPQMKEIRKKIMNSESTKEEKIEAYKSAVEEVLTNADT